MNNSKTEYAITDGIIFTGERMLTDHSIIIKDNRIEKITPNNNLKENISKNSVQGRLIVPGFVNAHHHIYSALATGMSVKPAANFLEILENLWWKLDNSLTIEDIRLSAKWTIAQCVKNGVTMIIDHHASYGAIEGSLDVIKKEIEYAGLRGVLCFETSDRHGDSAAAKAINENIDFCESMNVKKLFGLHAAFTLKDSTLKMAENMAWEGAGFHIHCAEDMIDVDSANGELIDRLDKFSLLRPKSLLIHGIYLRDDELKKIADNNSTVVHCPDSNMHNGVGNFNLVNANKTGVKIAAGTDGMYSNMLRAYKSAYELSRSVSGKPNVGFCETFDMYNTTQSMQSTFYDDCTLELDDGSRADLAVLDYRPHTPITIDNIWGHLIYGAAESSVFGTVVNGNILYWSCELKYLDEENLVKKCRAAAKVLWDKINVQ